MADSDLIKLYSGKILALAADLPQTAPLAAPGATVRKRSPLCGSTVTVEITVNDGRIAEFSQDVKACALGQAAASVVGANIIGRSTTEVETARDQLKAMLKSNGPIPSEPFDGLGVLEPAKEYRNRHASIMLTLDALVDALRQVENAACA